ncbi:aminoglycoside 6'-N-acetyltransferase [Porphyrobacter sp. YT40]|uniref:aminoglycoside 6'-N-acetyltransferase n=1 Tax=Porphyrobacter sp. YT40 TaxID=2547601 RepID=UPI0011430B65|nr:aminoglycoside 6'-N-acetyltransferase [Porphyrobacter sp. YT40]QDH36433.1 GNAT family N-acetyltransferase [Porphyrobacter sp. YT40]
MNIIAADSTHLPQWARLRISLWAWDTVEDHQEEAEELYLSGNPDRTAFVALDDDQVVVGFAEATIRRDYVEGCDTSPVVFLEGIYVDPTWRKRGVARALSNAVAEWGTGRDAKEYASNALLDNVGSHAFHAAIGFSETERVVFFKRPL